MFLEFTPLASKHGAINLGQGFPGWSPPDFAREAATNAINAPEQPMNHQYCRSAGHPELVTRLAKRMSTRFGRDVDPMSEVLVTNGATGAIYNALTGLLNPGDEVAVIEPAFDIYKAQVDMAGATLRSAPLSVCEVNGKKEWVLDAEKLRAALNEKTRVFIIISPHNPTGKVFSRKELETIAEILKDYPQVVVISDEVYENLYFDDNKPTSIASLPGMWDRTITVSSSGKTFSTTGWKVGWAVGPQHLIRCAAIANSWVVFSVSTPLQLALADMLDRADQPYKGSPTYYHHLREGYAAKRKLLAEALTAAGIDPIMPEGSFFVVGDTSKLQVPEKWLKESMPRDWALCRWLTVEYGVTPLPLSAFYFDEDAAPTNYARFVFCKPDSELREAAKRLSKLKKE